MIKSIKVYAVLLVLIFIASCNGQKKSEQSQDKQETQAKINLPEVDPYFVESFTTNTSYGPTNITRNIVQDRNGDIWFASWEGIIRYDGESFTNFTNKEGLRRFRAFSVLEDRTGNLWFGTIGAGVYRYELPTKSEGEKQKGSFTNFTTKEGLVNNDVGCIYQDKKGNIWFGTRVGLSCYDGTSFRNFTTEDGLADNDINAIIEDNSGNIWFAARGYSCYYDGTTFTKVTNDEGMSFTNVRSIIKNEKGTIWLGGNDGLWSYDGNTFTNFTRDFIGNIYEDKKGNIWFAKSEPNDTYTMRLYRYEGESLSSKGVKPTEIVKGNGQIFGIMEDRDGNIWFGNGRGVCRYDGTSFNYFDDRASGN